MAEFNPYKLEEEKWTPKNVYEILPPNAVSWSDYDFGQGTDNVDQEAAKNSLIDGFVDFFKELFGTAGQILGGAIELGGAVLGGFVDGVVSFIGGIANAIGSIFGGGSGESPDLPLFNPIKTNLEAAIQPSRDKINESWQKTEEVLAEQEVLRGQMAESLDEMRDASARAKAASERAGVAITEAEAASAAATEARETLESYNTALNKRITTEFNKAMGEAGKAISQAEATSSELVTMNTQLGEITQQASDLNTKLEEHNKKFTDGLATANTAIDEAVSVTAAVKKLADENKAKVASAISKADKANDDLALLTPKVTDAVAKAGKASSDVSALTPKVTSASEDAAKASQDVAALTPKVTAAQDKADKAASDLSTLTPKVTAAQNRADSAYTEAGKVRSEVTPQIEAAQTKGESALAVADKAVDWLKNPVEIGTSVIAVDPETKRPYYANPLELVDDNPPGTSGPTYMSPASMSTEATYGPKVPVDSKIKYTVSFWAKASKAGSIINGQFRTQEDGHYAPDGSHIVSGAVSVSNPPQPSNKGEDGEYVHDKSLNSLFIQGLKLPTEWTYYETEIQFSEGVTAVRIARMYWNFSEGGAAEQYISGLDIRPQIPTQASVDKAQNDAIKANQDILRQQEEINEAQRVANLAQDNFNDSQTKWNTTSTNATKALADAAQAQKDVNAEQKKFNTFQTQFNKDQIKWNKAVARSISTQDTVNKNFRKWTDGATKAVEANTTAIKALNAPQTGSSIVPMVPGTDTPTWIEPLRELSRGDQTADSVLPESVSKYYRYSGGSIPAGESQSVNIPYKNAITVDPNLEYEASWYTRVTSGKARYMYISMKSPETGWDIVKKAKDGEASSNTWGNPVRPLITPASTTWTKHTSRFKFAPGTRTVYITDIYFNNSGNSAGAYFYIADLQIAPKVPNQADVDDAQNKAIKANKDLLVEQERINQEQKKFNKLNTAFEVEQKKINNTQTGINALNTKADSSLLQGLKALGKKSLGASLVPYKTPSTKEVEDYAAGRLNYDPWADPEYLNAGHSIVTPSRGRVALASSTQGTKDFTGSYVTVDSSIKYKVKFHTYTGSSGSMLYIDMYDQNGALAIAETPFSDRGKVAGCIVDGLTLPRGVKEWSGVIKFKEGTTQVKLGTFYWNHSNGSLKTTQEFGGLEIVPNIPDANVVNELQDNAIRKNTEVGSSNKAAIEALSDGLDASIELSTVNDLISQLETRIHEEEKARAKLQTKIDDLQNEMIPRTIVSDDRETYDDYVELDGNTITAKPGWSGQMAITYTRREGRGTESYPYFYQTRVTRKNVPDGTTRSWKFSGSVLRVDYWIYQGKARSIELENRGGFLTGSKWEQRTERTIASHKVGKTYGTGKIEWKTQLKNANRGTTYRLIVRVTGQPDKTYTWSSVGPLTGLGSGIVTLKFDYEFNLPDDATVSIVAYTNGSTAYRTMVNYSSGILTYVEKK